jgi:hypothetical protein
VNFVAKKLSVVIQSPGAVKQKEKAAWERKPPALQKGNSTPIFKKEELS